MIIAAFLFEFNVSSSQARHLPETADNISHGSMATSIITCANIQGPRLRPPARYVIARKIPRIDVDVIAGSEDLRSRFASSVQLACAKPNTIPDIMTWITDANPLDISISMTQRRKKTSSTIPPTTAARIPRSLNREISRCILATKGMALIVYKTYTIPTMVARIHAIGEAIEFLSKPRFWNMGI